MTVSLRHSCFVFLYSNRRSIRITSAVRLYDGLDLDLAELAFCELGSNFVPLADTCNNGYTIPASGQYDWPFLDKIQNLCRLVFNIRDGYSIGHYLHKVPSVLLVIKRNL